MHFKKLISKLVSQDPSQNNKGFTLVEVLIAILLLAFISLHTFKMVDNSITTKENVLREDQALLQSLTAISRLDVDISQMYSPLYSFSKSDPISDPSADYPETSSSKASYSGKTKNGMIIPQFQAFDKSTIIFLTTSNRRKIADAKESRFTWVKYSVRPSEKKDDEPILDKVANTATNELIRQTISTNIFSPELNWSEVKAQVLMEHIKSLEFSFWDERAKKFATSIQDLNENKNSIRSIKMELIWVDENNNEQKIEKTYRILYPYFNPKLDDSQMNSAYDGGMMPPNLPDPNINDSKNAPKSPQGGSRGHF